MSYTHFYNTWKDDSELPIECLINTILLYKEKRQIVQFDLNYYQNNNTQRKVKQFVNSCIDIVEKEDSIGNIVIYLKKNKESIEKKLMKIGKGNIENAFRTSKFADILDPVFYSIKGPYPSIFQKNRVAQVSFNVVRPSGKTGALLLQMTNVNIGDRIPKIYKYFITISKEIEKIDPELQTTVVIHTKPGLWTSSQQLITGNYRKLRPL